MRKVVAPDGALREVDSATYGVRYKRQPDGTFNVADSDVKALVQYGGFVQPDMGMGRRAEGYRCNECGFGSWFTKCSRCGGTCKREVGDAL